MQQDVYIAILCMAISLIADVFDGAAARMLNVASPLGKVLDSLADLVSFCVMPGIITYQIFLNSEQNISIGLLATLFFILMGCLRLARFTVNNDEDTDFKGLPTPASAIALVALWILFDNGEVETKLYITFSLFGLGLLNVSTLTMMSVKDIASNGFKKITFGIIGVIGIVTYVVNPNCTLVTMISVYLFISIFYHLSYSGELSRH